MTIPTPFPPAPPACSHVVPPREAQDSAVLPPVPTPFPPSFPSRPVPTGPGRGNGNGTDRVAIVDVPGLLIWLDLHDEEEEAK